MVLGYNQPARSPSAGAFAFTDAVLDAASGGVVVPPLATLELLPPL